MDFSDREMMTKSEPGQDAPASLDTRLEALDDEISRLGAVLDRHFGRLSAVLQPEQIETSGDPKSLHPGQPMSPVSERLETMTRRLRYQRENLAEIDDRLDLS